MSAGVDMLHLMPLCTASSRNKWQLDLVCTPLQLKKALLGPKRFAK